MNDDVEVIRSNKGGMKVIHRGYMYTVHKRRQSGGIRWRCTQRSLHCKGSISTGMGLPRINMPHNHIPDPHSVALARFRQVDPDDVTDVNSLLTTECDDEDSIPLQKRHELQTQNERLLHSHTITPTKMRVTRQLTSENAAPVAPRPATHEEVCLRWNSHHSNMQNVFGLLLAKEQYVDVTLSVENKILKCHRIILSSCSQYFEEILGDLSPIHHPVIFMRNTPFWIVKALVDFMYVGEVNVDQGKLPELLDVAEQLRIKGLTNWTIAPDPPALGKDERTKRKPKTPIEPPPPQQIIIPSRTRSQAKPTTKRRRRKRRPSAPKPSLDETIDLCDISDPLHLLQPQLNDGRSEPRMRKRKSLEDDRAMKPATTRPRRQIKMAKYQHETPPPPLTTPFLPPTLESFSDIPAIKAEPLDDYLHYYGHVEHVEDDLFEIPPPSTSSASSSRSASSVNRIQIESVRTEVTEHVEIPPLGFVHDVSGGREDLYVEEAVALDAADPLEQGNAEKTSEGAVTTTIGEKNGAEPPLQAVVSTDEALVVDEQRTIEDELSEPFQGFVQNESTERSTQSDANAHAHGEPTLNNDVIDVDAACNGDVTGEEVQVNVESAQIDAVDGN